MRKIELIKKVFVKFDFIYFVSIFFFFLFIFFNSVYVWEGLFFETPESKYRFFFILFDCVMASVIALPFINKVISKFENSDIERFLGLPQESEKFVFPEFVNFLSAQALASFLGSYLVSAFKVVFPKYGPEFSAFLVFVLYAVAIAVGVVSLVRFIYFFKHSWWKYSIVVIVSVLIMWSFITIGMQWQA